MSAKTSPTASAPHGPLLIDAKEVARRLGLSERTIWRLNILDKLPAPVPVGSKSKRWRAREIGDWVAAGCPDRKAWEAMAKGA